MPTATPTVEPEYLRTADACRFLSVSRRHLYNLVSKRILRQHRLGPRCLRYSRADLRAAAESLRR